jgi:lysophospholipase L1-like esterase
MKGEKRGEASYYDAKNCLLFNEHRRLYMGIADGDARRLAQVYDLTEAEVTAAIAGWEAELSKTAAALAESAGEMGELEALRALPPLLFIGDSNSSFRYSYLNVLRKLLERRGLAVADTSIPGLNSQDVVDHFEDQVAARRPRVAAVMIGTNDVRRSSRPLCKNITGIDEFEANLDFILGRLSGSGATTLALSIPPIDSRRMGEVFGACGWSASAEDIASYNARIARSAARWGARLVDSSALFAGEQLGEVLIDGLHLKPASHARVAALFLSELAAALKSRGSMSA